ncbi:hypothetical protein PV327_007044 [Microctonus hyperodae]|uniref:XPG N-terminal domain-containing protein n=1 Tax=Microctonus hyperodae TaxID=165561 RepID=A0AA39F5I6_MICHY|nr:hypothetical protein PV327_007044 [Microctonus hyperodae]
MGIPGLTTYIENRAHYYLEPFELHDTILIIDGWNLSSQLYCTVATCNHAFGGDYDQFAHCVFQFFKDLLQCKVEPLVILDGGWERKKKHTLIERFKQRIKIAENYYTVKSNNPTLFPILLPEVFVDVMKKMGIRYAMSTFEADDSVSSIAKILNVPVLSYDSDFFIYGVNYIPFHTLDPYIVKRAQSYVKRCRIYRVEKLLEKFKGLDITVLPLASILLGNDYIDRKIFTEFLNRLKIKRSKNQNEQQRRIEIVFDWLKNHSLESAIAAILERLSCEKRKDILPLIEIIINGYVKLSTYMLRPLNIDNEIILDAEKNSKPFKFQNNLNNLDNSNDTINNSQSDNETTRIQLNCNKNNQDEDSADDNDGVESDVNETLPYDKEKEEEWDEENFAALVPQWFIDDHLAGKFPLYFINIITHRVYMMPVQIEDFSCHSAHKISFPLVTSICSLLTTSRDHNNSNTIIQLLIRKDCRLDRQYLSIPPSPVAFEDIRNLSVNERKKIIDDILQIRGNNKLNELPSSWRLYIACIIFWMRQNDDTKRTKLHLNALLLTMLIGIIDRKIGFNRINKNKTAQKEFSEAFNNKEEEIRDGKIISNDKSILMSNLIDSVTEEDCTAAMPFFLDHVNNKLYSMPKAFCANIVHVYAQFQACLRHAMHLNALLGHVYIQPSPSEFLNGTMYYNLYSNFSKRPDVHTYIATKLKDASRLLEIFKGLYHIVINELQDVTIEERSINLKRKRRKNTKKTIEKSIKKDDSTTIQSDIDDTGAPSNFYDPSNLFTLLHVT